MENCKSIIDELRAIWDAYPSISDTLLDLAGEIERDGEVSPKVESEIQGTMWDCQDIAMRLQNIIDMIGKKEGAHA